MAAGFSALSGDVLERQEGMNFLGKRLGVTREREQHFPPFKISAKVMCQMRAAYQGSRTRVIALWQAILLLGQWKGGSRVSKAENFIYFRTKTDLANFFGNGYNISSLALSFGY
jgi:hypothetical protein